MIFQNWTDAQTGLVAMLTFTTIFSVLGDAYTTMIGLQHGFVEANPIEKFLFAKVGQTFAAFLTGVATLVIGAAFLAKSLTVGCLFLAGISVAEGVQTFRNYLKLKAAKISLK